MVTITQLEYLLAVDKEKHFGRAARLCHVSQPSLSTQLQKLEEELGIIIFDRSKKPILTTEDGLDIISQAKTIIREHKKLFDIASIGGQETKGDFSLAVIPTLSPYLLPLFIKEFTKRYPKVNLSINESKTEDIIKGLINDELDAGLLVTPLEDDRLIERHLFFEPFYGYVSTEHPLAKRRSISEKDLGESDLWLLEEGHCFRNQVLKICSLSRNNNLLKNIQFESGNLETLKNLIKKNSGYTLLPELAVNELSAEDKKSFIKKFQKPVPTREVSIVHSRSFLKEKIVHGLERTIVDNLPKNIRSLKKDSIEVVGIL